MAITPARPGAQRPGSAPVEENPLSPEELKTFRPEVIAIHRRNIITPNQARKYTKYRGNAISQMLKDGVISNEEAIETIAPMIPDIGKDLELEKHPLPDEITDYLQENVARAHNIMPVKLDVDSGTLYIAIPPSKATNRTNIKDIAIKGHPDVRRVNFILATEHAIANQIDKNYRGEKKLKAMTETIAIEDAELEISTSKIDFTEDSEANKFVDEILKQAIKDGASDIHFEPGLHDGVVRFRSDGMLRKITSMPHRLVPGITNTVKNMSGIDIAQKRKPNDGRLTLEYGPDGAKKIMDFRVATMPVAVGGEQIVMRLLDNSQASVELQKLGFSEENLGRFRKAYQAPYGMVLVTGPTGSGKSTTLYATLNEVVSVAVKIITVENPVEYKIDGINQVQINNEAGMTFPNAIRAILRSDPDILLVGEIRDSETAEIAVEAGLTGHLLLSTLHTNDAPSAVVRLTEMGIEPFLVGNVMNGVLAQRLLRRLCDNCKRQIPFDADKYSHFKLPEYIKQEFHEKGDWVKVGCHECGGLGYKGRLGVHEVLIKDDEIERLIMKGSTPQELKNYAIDATGMKTMREDGLLKSANGITSIEEVYRVIKE